MRRLLQPDPDEVASQPVHCFGCGRQIGVATDIKMAVYCTELCRYKPQLINFEGAVRDRSIVYLVGHTGFPRNYIADELGISVTRVAQVVREHTETDYLQAGRARPLTEELRQKRRKAAKIAVTKRQAK